MGGADTAARLLRRASTRCCPAGRLLRQQVVEQAPEGFEWVTLPAAEGRRLQQGVSPQTLSVAEDSKHQKEAAQFIESS